MRPLAALLVCLCLAAGLAACKPAGGGTGATPGAASESGDMSLGPANAKVTVVEYASVSCPVCAKWNIDNWAAFKAKYIDTGKVHYVLREMLTHDPAGAAAGFLLARCAGKDRYFQIVDAIYHQQPQMYPPDGSNHARDGLLKVAESAGFTEAQFDACVSNDAALLALNDRVDKESKAANIESTPTFVINGKQLVGYQDMATLDKAIAEAEAAAK